MFWFSFNFVLYDIFSINEPKLSAKTLPKSTSKLKGKQKTYSLRNYIAESLKSIEVKTTQSK